MITQGIQKGNGMFARRKGPFKLAKLIGWGFVVKFLLKMVDSKNVSKKVSDILAFKCHAIISDYPELGMDIDKQNDWVEAESILKKRE